MMHKGEAYMHCQSMDCFIRVIKQPITLPNGHIIVRVCWGNLRFTGNPWSLNVFQTIKLNSEQLRNWRLIEPTTERVHSGV